MRREEKKREIILNEKCHINRYKRFQMKYKFQTNVGWKLKNLSIHIK